MDQIQFQIFSIATNIPPRTIDSCDVPVKEVDEWFLGIYIDAIEWVEFTNTRGMSQFADGGIVGSKPYVSSANYINKITNYRKGSHYNKNKKTGEKACPFNSLYWSFFDRQRDIFISNQRVNMMYRTWEKNHPKNGQPSSSRPKSI